ncbi:Calmodulin-binding protein [Trema orientale]|uniref:Calmodulin-binding protein n=1 Tax=Trema orientale TaxID=63057 RepID=A0A2P5FTM8_TREOI|nr:Calmodulin-binding protein [Trema orientale]
MVRNKDKLWEHAEKLKGRFKCKFCERDFSGGSTRLKSHLSGIKGRDIDTCDKVPKHVQEEAYLEICGSNKKARIRNCYDADNSSPNSAQKNGRQPDTMDMGKKTDKNEVDKLLFRHLILNSIPFDVVQTPSFIRLVKGISEYGAGYELPCQTTLTTKLVSDSRTEVGEYIKRVKASWTKTGCTLMCHKWRNMKQQTFMNVVACSPEGAVFLNSFEISDDRESGVYLKDLLSSVIEDIGREHVVQFISDNASNFESAGDMLVEKYPYMYKTRCAAHGIQLLLKDMYDQVSWIQQVLDDSKLIVTHIYKHTDVLSLMRVLTNGRELKHPCVTRFASNFLVLQSILNVEDELRQLVASSEWMRLDYSKKKMAERVASIIQRSEFWNQGQEVLQVMEPLVRVLCLVDGHVSTSGYLYEAMERAKEIIKQRCSANESKYMKILELFEYRRQYIIHPIHAAAAFLNPAYMHSEKFEEDCEMKKGINFILESLVSCDEKEAFMRQVQVYREKLASLFTTTATTMMKTSHPRIWWDYCGDALPVLKKYAVRILSQPCSSSTCAKRNELTTNMFDNLVHMRMNMFMMEKFNAMEAEKLVPISLDKVNKFIEYCHEQDGYENELVNLIDKSTFDDVMNESDFPRNCLKETHSSKSGSLKLQFLNHLSLPVSTGSQIEGEEYSTLQIALVDCFTGQIVKYGPESSARVEIVVLEDDFDGDEGDNWTVEEFKNRIVREGEGKKPVLTGDTVLNLKDGVGYVGEISFTDNSSWTGGGRFRLGARIVDNSDGTRVLEAKTESFHVMDHHEELYKKHHPPSPSDEVWRLEEIERDGAFHKRLSQETGVVSNVVGQLTGLPSEGQYVPLAEKADAHKTLISAFKHCEAVVPFDSEASLTGGSAHFTNVLSSSSSPCSSWSKHSASHKISGFDYAPSPASSVEFISSRYCVGSDIYASHTTDNMYLCNDQTFNFPGHQLTDSLICNLKYSTQALCSDDHMQFFNTNLQPQKISWDSPGDLQSIVDSFLSARSIEKAQRRWTKLVTVLKWFLVRASLKGTHVGKSKILVIGTS